MVKLLSAVMDSVSSNSDEKGKKINMYKVACKYDNGEMSFVEFRYSQMYKFYEKMRKLHSDTFKQVKIPSTSLLRSQASQAVINQRIKALNAFFVRLLEVKNVHNDADFKEFFEYHLSDSDSHEIAPSDQSDEVEKQLSMVEQSNQKLGPGSFEYLKTIGQGAFSSVYLATLNKEPYAVKVMKKNTNLFKLDVKRIMLERKVLLGTDTPTFLVKMKYAFQTKEKLYFVMEFVNGGELYSHLQIQKRFGESRSRLYCAEIIMGIGFLHSKNIMYRDLKLENLLLDSEGHIKIVDFGFCKQMDSYDSKTNTFCGTVHYLAPEVAKFKAYSRTVDWWSLGVLSYEMIFGALPFRHPEDRPPTSYIVVFSKLLPISKDAQSFILDCLQVEPDDRIGNSKDDLAELQSHPFFQNIDWDDIDQRRITPEFVPVVKNKSDISQIDEEFTSLQISESLIQDSAAANHIRSENENQSQGEKRSLDKVEGFTFISKESPLGGHFK